MATKTPDAEDNSTEVSIADFHDAIQQLLPDDVSARDVCLIEYPRPFSEKVRIQWEDGDAGCTRSTRLSIGDD